jgi:hypothetical protein
MILMIKSNAGIYRRTELMGNEETISGIVSFQGKIEIQWCIHKCVRWE